jgi:hypothetical protein
MRHYNADDARREAIVQAMKGHVRAARLDAEYDADIEYMEHALVALVDGQLAGAVAAARAEQREATIRHAAEFLDTLGRGDLARALARALGGQ